MIQSKAGKKLNPIIAVETDAIYKRDPFRYAPICRWVWRVQKNGWPDEAIAEALRMANPVIDNVTGWWPYLTALLPKAKAKATETESDNHKSADMALASEFVEFLKRRAEKPSRNIA